VSKPLVVNNKTFNYPTPGESPGWGDEATAWATEITNSLSSVAGPGDVPTSTSQVLNNQLVSANVVGLAFDTTVVRGATINYSIARSGVVSSVATAQVEEGTILITFNGSTWELSRSFAGEANVDITITNAGQVQYTSSDISGGAGVTGYLGKITFKATAFAQ
jgi:hypothetical protein